MRFEYSTRLPGTSAQFHMLKVFKEGEEHPLVFTSKKLSYLKAKQKELSYAK